MSIKRMQKAGLLRKTADEKDLRVNFIKLTEKGEQVEKISFANLNRADKQMLSGFSPDEIQQLYGYMERMCKNLERIGDTGNVE
jgi:DNA-binding MarR family transcriptional regulator